MLYVLKDDSMMKGENRMKKIVKKSLYLFLAFSLVISFLFPTMSIAYEIVGNESNPTLTIHKYEQEPNANQSEGTGESGLTPEGIPLPGVEFTLTQTHVYHPKTDEWEEVEGAPFTRVTDSNGKIVIENIEIGRYKVQETAGPPHVKLNTEEFFVDIPMTNPTGDTLNYDVHIYPKNETIRGAVELLKLDGEAEGQVGLAGVVFELYRSNDELVEDNLVTDSTGYIRVNGLPYGDYYFKEIAAPDGYIVFGEKKPFSITESGTVTIDGIKTGTVETIEITNYQAPAIEKTINGSTETHETNRETEYTYNLNIAFPEDIVDYQEFIVTDILDDRLNYTGSWNVEGIDQANLTFQQNGQTLTWTVNNFEALDGIETVTINFTAEIREGVEIEEIPNSATIDFTNESGTNGNKESNPVYVVPLEGSINIIKQDSETSERLVGAEFELRDAEGNVVVTGTTDSNGELEWAGLDYGDYQLIEIRAPEGYRLLTNPIDITINSENSNVTITVDNQKTGWVLPATGGIGTTFFTAIGLSLMLLAAVLYYLRQRKLRVE